MPIRAPKFSTNRNDPSRSDVIWRGLLLAVGRGYSVKVPSGVIRPILFPTLSVNHRFPSGPAVMSFGLLLAVGMRNSVIAPLGVIRPILFVEVCVNHTLPSGPAPMPRGLLEGVGIGKSVTTPFGVTRPIVLLENPVNHTLPSGPNAIPCCAPFEIGKDPVTCPAVDRRFTLLLLAARYQRLPSAPAVMKFGLPPVLRGNSVISPAGVIRPIWLTLPWVNHRFPSGPMVMSRGPLFAVGGQDLGFLPGSESEKMAPWAAAVVDALESIVGPEVIEEVLARDLLEVLPLTHIRGRSLTNAWVVIDEAQNLERTVLLTALSRLGRGSKVVLTHDVAQRDNLRVGRHDGVVSVIETLKGHPLFAHVTLTRSERSAIAALVTQVLDG